MEQLRYYVFNKKKDFVLGCSKNIQVTEQGIALEAGKESGSFFSRLLDSGEEGNQWHRAVIQDRKSVV